MAIEPAGIGPESTGSGAGFGTTRIKLIHHLYVSQLV